MSACVICKGSSGDDEIDRVEVWQDDLWRLTVSLASEIAGFAYLEPKRHIPNISDLNGQEAKTFGQVIAKCCAALKQTADAETVYVYIFGDGVPHLHVHLAPHKKGDALNDQIIKGELLEEKMANGMTRFSSLEYPSLPRETLNTVATNVRMVMNNV